MAKLSPIGNNAQFINGVPANGAKLFFYAAGSSAKQTTYTDEAGLVPQTNPIILDSRGEPSQPIWLTEGLDYKVVFTSSTDTDPPVSPIWDIDNVTGINDSSLTIDQWVNSGVTPLYVSATQFTLSGDQTSAFQVNRRVKLLVTAGTVYGYISASSYAALTTITVVLDSGILDSGLSSVQLGLITPNNTSLFLIKNSNLDNAYINDLTTATFDPLSDYVPIADASDSFKKKKALITLSDKLQPFSAALSANTLVNTLAASSFDFRPTSLNSGSYNTVNTGILTLTVATTASLGLTTLIQGRLALLIAYNAGAPVLCISNLAGGLQLDETNLISPTTIGAGSTSASVIYSASAVAANSPYRVVGFVDVIWTSGVGFTTLTEFQGAGGQSMIPVAFNAQGVAPLYACRAWVNFNGTGVVSIRASGNVSSITDNGTGDYTVNFAISMQDANYSMISSQRSVTNAFTTASFVNAASGRLTVFQPGGAGLIDSSDISASIFR